MNKVAIYARVSTIDNQEYERQISDLTRIILLEGYEKQKIEIYAEKISGYKKNEERPELTKLLNIIESKPTTYDAIYVTEVSRLGRDPRQTRDLIEKICELKVPIKIKNPSLCTLNEDGTRNNFVHMMLGIAIEFSDIETKLMKTRMKSGKLQRAIDGKTSNNNISYGYMAGENGMQVVNPETEGYVKLIFELYKSGIGTRVIANTLNQLQVPTKYNTLYADKVITYKNTHIEQTGDAYKWSDVVVRQILINPIYKGEKRIKIKNAVIEHIENKKVIKSPAEYTTTKKIEPIVSKELFNECNELLKSKNNRTYMTKYEYLLKDIMRCGVCGKKYLGKYVAKNNGDKVYKCTSYLKSGEGCGNRSINIGLIESVIFDQISNSETLLKYLDNPKDILKQTRVELIAQEQQLKNEESHISAKDKQLNNLIMMSSVSENLNLEKFTNAQAQISREIESSKKKILLLKKDIFSKTTTIANFDNGSATKEMIINAKNNRPELRVIFQQFIDKIIINGLDKDYVLATVFIKVNGVRLVSTLKLFIYANGVRNYGGRNEKVYKYLATTKFENNPVYNANNILLVDIEDILLEFRNMIEIMDYNNVGMFTNIVQFKTIKRENYIYINEDDI